MTLGQANARPFSMTVVKHTGNFSGGAGTMMTRAPWQAPVNKYYIIRKLVVANVTTASSGLALGLWDQDLSNTTPVARGSSASPLLMIPLTTPSTTGFTSTIISRDQMPAEYFQAGITMATYASGAVVSQTSGIFVSAELEVV